MSWRYWLSIQLRISKRKVLLASHDSLQLDNTDSEYPLKQVSVWAYIRPEFVYALILLVAVMCRLNPIMVVYTAMDILMSPNYSGAKELQSPNSINWLGLNGVLAMSSMRLGLVLSWISFYGESNSFTNFEYLSRMSSCLLRACQGYYLGGFVLLTA